MTRQRVRVLGLLMILALATLPAGQALAQGGRGAAVTHRQRAGTVQLYHFTSSLVPSPGAQVVHIEGILSLTAGANGALTGSSLRLTTGETVQVTGSYTRTLSIAMSVGGMDITGGSTAVSGGRISGVFTKMGGTVGFWVATVVAADRAGARYTFASKITSGPDSGTTYDGALQLYGDKYGGLVGFLTLKDGTALRVNGQDVNGNVNMLIVVRAGTPMFVSGTTVLGGTLRGTIAGPLAGDEGRWTAAPVK